MSVKFVWLLILVHAKIKKWLTEYYQFIKKEIWGEKKSRIENLGRCFSTAFMSLSYLVLTACVAVS